MPPSPYRPAALAWQVFRGSEAIRDRLITRHQLRGASWVRLMHDVYADARLDRDHELLCRAASLRLPPGVLMAGPSAAYLHGIEHAATFTDEVHVLAPMQFRLGSQRGIRVHTLGPRQPPQPTMEIEQWFALPPDSPPPQDSTSKTAHREPSTPASASTAAPASAPSTAYASAAAPASAPIPTSALPPTTAPANAPVPTPTPGAALTPAPVLAPAATPIPGARPTSAIAERARRPATIAGSAGSQPLLRSSVICSAWECAVWLEPVQAVGIIDAMLRQKLVDRAGLEAVARANTGRPGGRRAEWVFGLADAGAQSPPESQLRVRLILAGLPRPVTQHPVLLATGRILHPDLSWPEYRVAVEYDGHWHSDPDQIHLDRQRLNLLVTAGWRVLHVTSRRLHRDFPGLVREVRTALAAAGWHR
ncbi:hypothetical protein JMF97_20885 [Micromonospora fiedleri]|uniref:DUF559 domain-containing protein n=1 Tax=Micromonospora fiedleri TaxID=1157498 RepID=A0ABS1USM5_9ACTN|nr:hypothetical protein [Micromonospora fiedleri]